MSGCQSNTLWQLSQIPNDLNHTTSSKYSYKPQNTKDPIGIELYHEADRTVSYLVISPLAKYHLHAEKTIQAEVKTSLKTFLIQGVVLQGEERILLDKPSTKALIYELNRGNNLEIFFKNHPIRGKITSSGFVPLPRQKKNTFLLLKEKIGLAL